MPARSALTFCSKPRTMPAIRPKRSALPTQRRRSPGKSLTPDTDAVITNVTALLKLANDPGFQKSNPKGTAKLFADLLNVSGQPNVTGKEPHLHDTVFGRCEMAF